MNIGIICNLIFDSQITGVICVDNNTGDIGYMTDNDLLDEMIEIILDQDELELMIQEKINRNRVVRIEKVSKTDPNYLMAFNYNLPYPYRILSTQYSEGNIEEVVKEVYEYIISRGELNE